LIGEYISDGNLLELGLWYLSESSEAPQFRTTLCVLETPKSHPVRAGTLVATVECEQVKSLRHEDFGSSVGMTPDGK
jgi:hypothetical protein